MISDLKKSLSTFDFLLLIPERQKHSWNSRHPGVAPIIVGEPHHTLFGSSSHLCEESQVCEHTFGRVFCSEFDAH